MKSTTLSVCVIYFLDFVLVVQFYFILAGLYRKLTMMGMPHGPKLNNKKKLNKVLSKITVYCYNITKRQRG